MRPESVNADDRIIPARAGFTGRGSSPRRRARDHPRSRGVYRRVPSIAPRVRGSSPLARGLPVNSVGLLYILRIIPARAGFTPDLRRYVHNFPDHPRSRGVYTHIVPPSPRIMGSSPLARGLLLEMQTQGKIFRIIPARAGFTACRRCPAGPARDHPRSRGVYAPLVITMSLRPGSSPLARGLPDRHAVISRKSRIIPARAGFTDRSTH